MSGKATLMTVGADASTEEEKKMKNQYYSQEGITYGAGETAWLTLTAPRRGSSGRSRAARRRRRRTPTF